MEVDHCIRNRRSIREYKNSSLKLTDIAQILDAAVYAPSSGNVQNWRFIVVSDKHLKESLSKACFDQVWMNTAPVFVVICNDPRNTERMYKGLGKKYALINCVAVAQNILLKAYSLGIASCWVCAFDPDHIRQILNIPSHIMPESIITLGYSNVKKPDVPKRNDIHENTFFDVYGNTKMNASHFIKIQAMRKMPEEQQGEERGKLKKFLSRFIEKEEGGFLP